jgi:hypothetical protein
MVKETLCLPLFGRRDFIDPKKIWIKQQKYNFKRRKGSYSYGEQGSYVYTNPKDVEKRHRSSVKHMIKVAKSEYTISIPTN